MDEKTVQKLLQPYGRETPPFSLDGLEAYARVVGIHDSCTLRVTLPIASEQFHQFSVRLDGFETRELKSSEVENDLEKRRARDKLFELIVGHKPLSGFADFFDSRIVVVRLVCGKFDSHGHLRAQLYSFRDTTRSVNQMMMS